MLNNIRDTKVPNMHIKAIFIISFLGTANEENIKLEGKAHR